MNVLGFIVDELEMKIFEGIMKFNFGYLVDIIVGYFVDVSGN